jgi:mitochondrial fission protein ELM1
MQSQALGLAEAAGLAPEMRSLLPRFPWRHLSATLWPRPLAAFPYETLAGALPGLVISCGGTGGAVGAALKKRGPRVVQIQNPRMPLTLFDLVIANRHDEIAGPNVLTIRTALHRVTPERLAEAAAVWAPRFAHLPRPLVAMLVGGNNGRFRLDGAVATGLANSLRGMMEADRVGLILTPSRRSGPEAMAAFRSILNPMGAEIWDGEGENPYFGMLALADLIVVTMDSVSMVSEACATQAPVMVASLPGRSRRIGQFLGDLTEAKRVRPFAGRYAPWPVTPLDDTAVAAQEMRHRLGF